MVILILQDHDSHGPEFHKHMLRINKSSGSNITVTNSLNISIVVL
jgi:hypothetical protein